MSMAMFSTVGTIFSKRVHFAVQEPVIVDGEHALVENILQAFEVEDHARHGIGIAFDCDLNDVVVAVAQGIRGGSVDAFVFGVRQFRGPADVGRGEFYFFRNYHRSGVWRERV